MYNLTPQHIGRKEIPLSVYGEGLGEGLILLMFKLQHHAQKHLVYPKHLNTL
jgi:hypothetical protein